MQVGVSMKNSPNKQELFNAIIGPLELTQISDIVLTIPTTEAAVALNRDDLTTYLAITALKMWMTERHLECGYDVVLDG